MKRFSFVHMLVMLVVVITLASCGMTQPIYEDGYERPSARRVYSDPYYGGQTVLVRDPYTGQIYEAILLKVPLGKFYNFGFVSKSISDHPLHLLNSQEVGRLRLRCVILAISFNRNTGRLIMSIISQKNTSRY